MLPRIRAAYCTGATSAILSRSKCNYIHPGAMLRVLVAVVMRPGLHRRHDRLVRAAIIGVRIVGAGVLLSGGRTVGGGVAAVCSRTFPAGMAVDVVVELLGCHVVGVDLGHSVPSFRVLG